MGRRYLVVLVVFCFGCGPNIPIAYYISPSCATKSEELEAIRNGVEEWDKATCAEVTVYKGVSDDKSFNMSDLIDEQFTVYCVDDKNRDVNVLTKNLGYDFAAISIGDIIIKRGEVTRWAWGKYYKTTKDKKSYPFTSVPDEYYYTLLKTIATHEFGHQLGRNEATGAIISVMHPNMMLAATEPSLFDIYGSPGIGGLCDFIDCPPRDQCPTRPTK